MPKEIHERMVNVYGTDVPSYATVTRWAKEFKRGRDSLEDDPRSGRPSDATDETTVTQVETLIMSDRRIKVKEICREVGISYGSVLTIIHEHLGMSKVSSRCVSRNLDHKINIKDLSAVENFWTFITITQIIFSVVW